MDEPLESEKACNMKHVPNKLECAYCKRNSSHGGECYDNKICSDSGCMLYKPDERGCINNKDFNISFGLYHEVPLLNTWTDGWTFRGVETEIRINRIQGLTWDTKGGYLEVHCNCDIFINEYHDDYVETPQRPKLTIVK